MQCRIREMVVIGVQLINRKKGIHYTQQHKWRWALVRRSFLIRSL